MATIGHVTKQADGRYVGKLKTLSIQANIEIIPVLEKSSEKQPDYQVFSGNVDCGAGWNRKGKSSQKDYVSLDRGAGVWAEDALREPRSTRRYRRSE